MGGCGHLQAFPMQVPGVGRAKVWVRGQGTVFQERWGCDGVGGVGRKIGLGRRWKGKSLRACVCV